MIWNFVYKSTFASPFSPALHNVITTRYWLRDNCPGCGCCFDYVQNIIHFTLFSFKIEIPTTKIRVIPNRFTIYSQALLEAIEQGNSLYFVHIETPKSPRVNWKSVLPVRGVFGVYCREATEMICRKRASALCLGSALKMRSKSSP